MGAYSDPLPPNPTAAKFTSNGDAHVCHENVKLQFIQKDFIQNDIF